MSLEDTDPDGALYATHLLPLLAAGNVTLGELRSAASRALLPRFRVGLYDPPERNPWNSVPASVLESAAHHALARRAAAGSFVLVKNEGGFLPFKPAAAGGPRVIALVGPTSNCSACGVNRYSGHPGRTVGILEGSPLPVVEVRPKSGSYDYTNKYTAGRTEYFCPADFDPSVTLQIQQSALAAFDAIGGRDYARVDVMVRPDGSPVVLEVNTLPGMTETSLLPKAAAAAGISFPQLCDRMVRLALRRQAPPR